MHLKSEDTADPEHWLAVYGDRPLRLETFVETPRCRGTCDKAANGTCLGQTKGRGKLGQVGKGSEPNQGHTDWLAGPTLPRSAYPLILKEMGRPNIDRKDVRRL
ncbi:MAG: DUF4338 domain-containing protein [Chromatiaceae bacterium]|nr:MAG: DUF4338 domain-containing protein [Chromatiaceae bacterium]